MLTIVIDIIVIIILIGLSAFFSSSETALTTISPHRLRSLVENSEKHAPALEKVLSDRDKMLSVILICNNIVNLAASALTTVLVQKLFGNYAVSIGTFVLTMVVLVFGEISPKTIATYRAERLALKVAPVIRFLMLIFTPLAAAVSFLSDGVLRILGVHKGDKQESYTESEIRSIVEVSSEEGAIQSKEKEIINNIFDFNDTVAREAMVPRVNVLSVSVRADLDEVIEKFVSDMYTRLPVYEEEESGYIGILNYKDLAFINEAEKESFSVRDHMRPLPYTFEQKRLSELFRDMKREGCNMMAVMDEYGVTVGIITMEDLLEEIVGDIRDEYDDDEEDEIEKVSENVYRVEGSINLSDINSRLGTDFESVSYESVGGFMIEQLDRLPEEGESVNTPCAILTAEEIDGARIAYVLIKLSDKDHSENGA